QRHGRVVAPARFPRESSFTVVSVPARSAKRKVRSAKTKLRSAKTKARAKRRPAKPKARRGQARSHSAKLVLGVDVGTGSARAGLFTLDGKLAGHGETRIKIWQTAPNHVEQSSNDIWRSVARAVRAALRAAKAKGEDVVGIGFDATCSLVALDRKG